MEGLEVLLCPEINPKGINYFYPFEYPLIRILDREFVDNENFVDAAKTDDENTPAAFERHFPEFELKKWLFGFEYSILSIPIMMSNKNTKIRDELSILLIQKQ